MLDTYDMILVIKKYRNIGQIMLITTYILLQGPIVLILNLYIYIYIKDRYVYIYIYIYIYIYESMD
jgi:hypothetical protein